MFTTVRTVGAATFAYSVALIIRPAVLAKPCGLTDVVGTVPNATALLIRAVGARDAAIGAAMFLAPVVGVRGAYGRRDRWFRGDR